MKKTIIGFVLIILAFLLLIFWELIGRDTLTMKEVAVFKNDLYSGQLVEKKDITYKKAGKNLLLEGSVYKNNSDQIYGKTLNRDVGKNQIVSDSFFFKDSNKSQAYLFVIKGEWLAMRSSSLRKDDLITILSYDGRINFGSYRVGSVRSLEEFEIIDDGIINNIEVFAPLKDYLKIRDYLEADIKSPTSGSLERKLIIVKVG